MKDGFFEILTAVIAGIGLFLLGVRVLSVNVNRALGFSFQKFARSITGGVAASAFWGSLAGFLTQSSRTLSVLFASLVRGGILAPSETFTFLVWSNIGCLFILAAAVFPVRDAAFVFMGVSGLLYSIGKPRNFERAYLIMIGLSLTLYGLSVVSEYAGEAVGFPQAGRVFELANTSPAAAFIAGVVLVLATQSYPAMMLLAVSMTGGALHWDAAMNIAMGAHIGSSFNAYFLGFGFRGRARQCMLSVYYYYIVAAALFYAAWGVCAAVSPGSFGEFFTRAAPSPELAAVFGIVSANLAAVFVLSAFRSRYARFLARLSPELEGEHSGRAKYIDLSALENPTLALDLASREHMRLVSRFPRYMRLLRYGNFDELEGELDAFFSVRERLRAFLDEIVRRASSAGVMEGAIHLKNRDDTSELIAKCMRKLAGKAAHARLSPPGRANLSKVLDDCDAYLERFGALLSDQSLEGVEAFLARAPELDARGAEMQAAILADPSCGVVEKGALLRIGGIAERFMWLLNRYAGVMLDTARPRAK